MSTIDTEVQTDRAMTIPTVRIPSVPSAAVLWTRMLVIASIFLGIYLLDQIALLLMDLWLLQSLGFEDVFWTNFTMGAWLFVAGFVVLAVAVAAPAFINRLARPARRRAIQLGVFVGVLAGYAYSGHVQEYLMFFKGRPFGESDPVFGHDIGFYVFDLHAIEDILNLAIIGTLAFLISSLVTAYIGRENRSVPDGMKRLTGVLGISFARSSVISFGILGALLATKTWIQRYYILVRDNADSTIANGAEYVDVTGFFSSVNGYTVSALAIFFGFLALALRLWALHRSTDPAAEGLEWRRIGIVSLLLTMIPGAAIDSGFRAMLALRNETQVTPNEPVIQLPYIKRHIDATRAAYGLTDIEVTALTPNGPDDPPADVDALLEDPAIQNAPLWPGYVSWLERLVDPEYVTRILRTGGDTTIYGPTLDTYRAQQKLRPYYDFMDVDTVRYEIDGEDRMFASSVRELPLVEPQAWLAWWGQRFVLFTHGQGLVAAPVDEVDDKGEPVYTAHALPPEATEPELATDNPDIYYGEGSGSMGYSNVEEVAEHDFPTDEGRAEVFLPPEVNAGVRIDSFLKRIVFGWKSRSFFDIAFSDLINSNTRVHYFRTPLERLEHLAPFLYVDTDPYAVSTEEGITWMLNGMTTTDRYPYSIMGELGDKSDRRSPTPRPIKHVNYVADAVKATVDAYTGQVNLYKFSDEPILETWDAIYPGLFEEEEEMPADLREQVQYPPQLFHIQFDDQYIYYHMTDPLTFFSFEDAFDDADEVVGPILAEGAAISFSMEPYYWVANTEGSLPDSSEESQFSMSMAFTPEGALNLRGIVTAYQEGDDYGKLSMVRVPKGEFFPGPEQADAAIDQDAFISQQIGLWNRRGLDVIRGHTTPLVVQDEVLYIEPLFIRSKQNPVPQIKRVVVVYRGKAAMGNTLEEALRAAIENGDDLTTTPVTSASEDDSASGG
jgi:uncharacterized membrane protein (UPF0182 family)